MYSLAKYQYMSWDFAGINNHATKYYSWDVNE